MATPYTLNINFNSNDDLNEFTSAFQEISVVKTPPTADGSSPTPVIWLNFAPWENNSIQWTENYKLYATTTTASSGAIIKYNDLSDDYAIPGKEYSITPEADVIDLGGDQSPLPGYYNLENQDSNFKQLTLGLAQAATVTSNQTVVFPAQPICATNVLYNTSIAWQPTTTVTVFASNNLSQGQISIITSTKATQVSFTQSNATQSVTWDPVKNQFNAGTNTSATFVRPSPGVSDPATVALIITALTGLAYTYITSMFIQGTIENALATQGVTLVEFDRDDSNRIVHVKIQKNASQLPGGIDLTTFFKNSVSLAYQLDSGGSVPTNKDYNITTPSGGDTSVDPGTVAIVVAVATATAFAAVSYIFANVMNRALESDNVKLLDFSIDAKKLQVTCHIEKEPSAISDPMDSDTIVKIFEAETWKQYIEQNPKFQPSDLSFKFPPSSSDTRAAAFKTPRESDDSGYTV